MCSRKPNATRKVTPSATPRRPPTWARLRRLRNSANASTWKLGTAAGAARKRKSSSANALSSSCANGAEWIWNRADEHFPGAIQIVDLFHAREHLWELARKLHPTAQELKAHYNEAEQKRWMMVHQYLLDNGKMKRLTVALKNIADNHPELTEKFRTDGARVESALEEYFRRNAKRMRYPKFRRLHLFVGSGVIEAGCKSVIGKRLKQSGMFWTVNGANAIIALRCCVLNNRFEDYCEERRVA